MAPDVPPGQVDSTSRAIREENISNPARRSALEQDRSKKNVSPQGHQRDVANIETGPIPDERKVIVVNWEGENDPNDPHK